MVQMAAGRRPVDAAVDSARELRIPLLFSSLTTAAAFLPTSLAQSTTGQYTRPLFQVITIALLSSWLLALTMTPLRCVLFLMSGLARRTRGSPDGLRVYRGLLIACARLPALTLAAVTVVFVMAMQGFRQADLHRDLRAAGRHVHRGGRGGGPLHRRGASRRRAGPDRPRGIETTQYREGETAPSP